MCGNPWTCLICSKTYFITTIVKTIPTPPQLVLCKDRLGDGEELHQEEHKAGGCR